MRFVVNPKTMNIYQTKNIKDYKLILEGLIGDWGLIYWHAILIWCNIIDDIPENKNKYWQLWVAELDNKNIGICGLFSHKEKYTEELWLGWFGLIPEYRNKNLGDEMLSFLENKARNLGCKTILSYVDKKGKPLNFYYRNGYQKICTVKEYLKENGKHLKNNFEDVNDHVISKKL